MVRDYELMYIVRPELDEDAVRTAVDSVHQLVETLEGQVLKTTLWGKRRLAYEVKHLRDGYYVILRLRLDGGRVKDLARALSIHDTVFRHLLVVQEGAQAGDEEDSETETGAAGTATAPGAVESGSAVPEPGAVATPDEAGAVAAPNAVADADREAAEDVPAAGTKATADDGESQMAGAVAGEEG